VLQTLKKNCAGKKLAFFIIRFSSQPGYFAGSYIDPNGNVGKVLIGSNPGFHIADGSQKNPEMWGSMRELIAAYSTIFKFPYKKTTNEVNNTARKKIGTEMLETERSYLKALNTAMTVFMNPLANQANQPRPIVMREEVDAIFSNLKTIIESHTPFLASLEKEVGQWSDETEIGKIFLELNPKLRNYTVYINNYPNAMETFQRLLKNANFKKFIDITCHQNPLCDQPNLSAYLINPVQRVPRYILMLSDIVKHTNESHPDHEDLKKALEAVKDTAAFINESKRGAENMQKMREVQSSIEGEFDSIVVEGRRFIKEGDLMEKVKKGGFKERHCFLFSDMILTSKKKKEKYEFKGLVPLKAQVIVMDITDTKSEKNIFKVGDAYFQAATQQEKDKWLAEMKSVLQESTRPKTLNRVPTMTLVAKMQADSESSSPGLVRSPSVTGTIGYKSTPPGSPALNRSSMPRN